jgi:hypothetical protein
MEQKNKFEIIQNNAIVVLTSQYFIFTDPVFDFIPISYLLCHEITPFRPDNHTFLCCLIFISPSNLPKLVLIPLPISLTTHKLHFNSFIIPTIPKAAEHTNIIFVFNPKLSPTPHKLSIILISTWSRYTGAL